ncbi:MAG: Ig-like domain-containing protein [Gammaproteobacteria bacterium]|nr:Ig-like domain-containing protein [Gammaproteobacteria bacterium]MDE0258820.1 Ig-like domain-containing protein [Gammaproteobacteria bacterium]
MTRASLGAAVRLGLTVAVAGCALEFDPPSPASIVVSPGSATFTFLGESRTFTATILDEDGSAMEGTVSWTTDAPAVLSVNSSGVVTALANGAGTVRAVFEAVSGTAAVTVNQTPTTLERVGGDAQTGSPGGPLVEPLVGRLLDAGQRPVAGVAVSFSPAPGSGSVTPAAATTDPAGEAQTLWTLGDGAGVQSVIASVAEGPNAVFTAMAEPPHAMLIHSGDGQVARTRRETEEPVRVRVISRSGAGLSGVTVTFEVTAGGGSVPSSSAVTDAEGIASAGPWTMGDPGPQELRATAPGVNRVIFRATALAAPVAELVAVEGDGQRTEIVLPVPVAPRVRAEDADGNPVSDTRVTFSPSGDSRVVPEEATTDSAGFAAVDRWFLGRTPGTTYTLTASVANADGTSATATFSAEATPAVYDIELEHVTSSLLTASQRAAFEEAERFWESAITGNLTRTSPLSRSSLVNCLTANQMSGDVPGDRVVDDLLIYVEIKEIDGRSGIFGGAGPCQLREDNSLPAVGVMFFDIADLDSMEANEQLEETIVHEMAHVIGFGTLWSHLGLLQDSARADRNANTHFTGAAAKAAFDEIRGNNYTDSDLVPVQHQGGKGVWNGHWRELVFRSELMTPFPDRGPNPMSVVSLASFVDIGYPEVDYSVADEYVLPPPQYAAQAAAGVEAPRRARRHTIDFGREILVMPLMVVDRDGNVVRYLRSPER